MKKGLILARTAALTVVVFMVLANFTGMASASPDTQYSIIISGERHETELWLQESMYGRDIPKIQIAPKGFTPISTDMIESNGVLHVIWIDATSRCLTTYYTKSVDAGNTWSTPVKVGGENSKLAVLDHHVYVASRKLPERMLGLYMSSDSGNTFTEVKVPEIACVLPDIVVSTDGAQVCWYGGYRNAATGQLENKAIYTIATHDTGLTWSPPEKFAVVENNVRELNANVVNGVVTMDWVEENIDSFIHKTKEFGSVEQITTTTVKPTPSNSVVENKVPASKLPPKKWTYIGYVDADNNLDSFGDEDVNEMEDVGSNADLNIIVLLDGLGSGDTKAYYIEEDADPGTITSPEIPLTDINPGWGTELNMGDPNTAIDFVKYVYANYPADYYLWDMWNHGGSWRYGMCSDDTDADDLTMLEVRTIYETLRADTGKIKLFDVAGYDECFMSVVSVAYDEMPYIDYILNSEDSIAGDGWEYNILMGHMADNLPDLSPEECGWWVFKSYEEFYGTSGALTTMSVVNSTLFYSQLVPAINNLAQKGLHEISAVRAGVNSAAGSAISWGRGSARAGRIPRDVNAQRRAPRNAGSPSLTHEAGARRCAKDLSVVGWQRW